MKREFTPCEMELLDLDLTDVLTVSPEGSDPWSDPFEGEDVEIK